MRSQGGMHGDLVVFTQPRRSPVDSRVQSGLTCRLTSEPDTMGTSWPPFQASGEVRGRGRRLGGAGAQDLMRTWMIWAMDSKYLFYDMRIGQCSPLLLVLPRSLLAQLCCSQVTQPRNPEPARPAHSPGGRCRQHGAGTAERQAAGGRR